MKKLLIDIPILFAHILFGQQVTLLNDAVD